MHVLDTNQIPSADDIARVLDADYPGRGDGLRRADRPTIKVLGRAGVAQESGWQTHDSDDALVVTAQWASYRPLTDSTHEHDATIIQVTKGGRDRGEGWAYCEQYVTPRILTEAEAGTVLALIASDGLPSLVVEGEL